MNCRYQRNIFQIIHKFFINFKTNFLKLCWDPPPQPYPFPSVACALPFPSLPFRRMRTQTESGKEAATVIRPGGGPPRRWPPAPCRARRAARPPWPGPRALRLAAPAASPALADCAYLACSSATPLLAVRVRSDGQKIS